MFGWLKRRKGLASAVAIAVVAGVPVTLAVAHKGFPVADVNLNARDVWVTNGAEGGRVNHQIDQLDATVTGTAKDTDVLQDGGDYFLTSASQHSVARIDQATAETQDQLSYPAGAQLAYGGNTLAILGADGKLWSVDTSGQLQFNAKTKPAAQLGRGAAVTVSKTGEVFAVSPAKHELVTIAHAGGKASAQEFEVSGDDPQITAVGETPVVLDAGGSRLRTPSKKLALGSHDEAAMALQQPSPASDYVLAATASGLDRVPLDGGALTDLAAGGTPAADTNAAQVPAPVQLGGCDYGAWASTSQYVYACGADAPAKVAIPSLRSTATLRFRVNHGVVALNDISSGDYWAAGKTLVLRNDWSVQSMPDTEKLSNTAKKPKPIYQSFAEQAKNRDPNKNHSPKAEPDTFGVRPGRATILPVLDNDTDQDGDVLTVAPPTPLPATTGRLDVIDGGRALQFTPASGYIGGFAFNYTVSDGRKGSDHSSVTVNVADSGTEHAPRSVRGSGVEVEAGQSVSYNVLQDWRDDDGDEIFLTDAKPADGIGTVSYVADGEITYTAAAGSTGTHKVEFSVSDGRMSAKGELTVSVGKTGSLAPIAAPDFAQAQLGSAVTIAPLANDTSRNGKPLQLVGADADASSGLIIKQDLDAGTVSITPTITGTFYAEYEVTAGDGTPQPGIIRIDAVDLPTGEQPPLAVADTVYLHAGQPAEVAPLDNDVSPSGRVLAVQQVTGGDDAALLSVQLLDSTVVRVSSAGALPGPVQLTYQLTDGVKTVPGTITVVPVTDPVTPQPPVAVDDQATVRAGDYATVDVLANDYSPDDTPFTLDPKLVSTKEAGGSAFISGQTVRFLAPKAPGSYSVTYGITDANGQRDVAQLSIQVVGTSEANQAPNPKTLTARVFAGSSVPITVPLDGIDPNGDSVYLLKINDVPRLGSITSQNATSFVYAAGADSVGTDEFDYVVEDARGKQATGHIRIAVVPRPEQLQPPVAVDDSVQVKPGATASVPVLANDSDPNGYPLSIVSVEQAPKQLTHVSVDGSAILFTASQTTGVYRFHYTIDNGHGGTQGAVVQVKVDPNAPPRYPTATDHFVDAQQFTDGARADVDALQGATNPSGALEKLTVSLPGVASKLATVSGGTVTVYTQPSRTIVPYQVTDPATKLTAKAFIIVPPKDVVARGAQATANPGQASGAPQQLQNPDQQAAGHKNDATSSPNSKSSAANGAKNNAAGKTPAGVSTPGTGASQKPTQPPADPGKQTTWVPPQAKFSEGDTDPITLDLSQSAYNPDAKAKAAITFSSLQQSTLDGIKATLKGDKLTLTPTTAMKKQAAGQNFHFTLTSGSTKKDVYAIAVVAQDSKGPAIQNNRPQKRTLKQGASVKIVNTEGSKGEWTNPHPDVPLRFSNLKPRTTLPSGVTYSMSGNTITVSASSGSGHGLAQFQYDVTTKTGIKTVGLLNVTVIAKPDPPKLTMGTAADGTISFTLKAGAANGSTITSYTLSGAGGTRAVKVGANTISGLKNGTKYTLTAQAHNAVGASAKSNAISGTPYGTPGPPTHFKVSAASAHAPSQFNLSWRRPAVTGGGTIRYRWMWREGNGAWQIGSTVHSDAQTITHLADWQPAGTYEFHVMAINEGSRTDSAWSPIVRVKITNPPKTVTLTMASPKPYYHVKISGFSKGSHTLILYCNGHDDWSHKTITADAKGNGSWASSATSNSTAYCGFPGSGRYVTVDGKRNG